MEPEQQPRWQPGDTVTMRYTGHFDGHVRDRPGLLQGWPHTVVEDSDEVLALWQPAGTRTHLIDLADASHVIPLSQWKREVLRLFLPGRPYSVWLWWKVPVDPEWAPSPAELYKNNEIRAEFLKTATPDQIARSEADRAWLDEWRVSRPAERVFDGWYVNLEAPFVRTPIGIDTSDNSLDLLVSPALEWRWKDEDTMDFWVNAGVFTREHVEQFYRDGEEVADLIEARRFPFDGSYLDFAPDPNWAIPALPGGWQHVPGYDYSHAIKRWLPNVDHPK